MPTWEFAAGIPTGFAFSGTFTRWLPVAGYLTANIDTETHAQAKVQTSYTWTNLYAICTAWGTNDLTLRSRVGAVDGNLLVTVNGTGTFQDTVNSDSLVSGNLINWQWSRVTGGSATLTLIGSTLQDASTNTTFQCSNDNSVTAGIPDSVTRWTGISGRLSSGVGVGMATTETAVQYTIRRATTYSNLRVFFRVNGLNGATLWRMRVDVGNGAQSISIAAGGTGAFEDTTNTDVVASGSEINYQIDTTASTLSACNPVLAQVTHTSTGREMAAGSVLPSSITADAYYGPEGEVGSGTATESQVQLAARAAFTAKNLMVNVTAHGADASDIFFRKNTANTLLTVNVPSSSTGLFEDTTNQVSIAVTDLYNYFRDGAGESISITIIGMEQGPGDAIFDLPGNRLNVLLRL